MQAHVAPMAALLLAGLSLLGAASAAHIPGSDVAILGRREAENGLKYMVEIRQSFLFLVDNHLGSGVLVSPEWVLTVGNTTKTTPLFTLYVKIGWAGGEHGTRHDIVKDGTKAETKDNILVLLKLKDSVTLNSISRPVNLPYQNAVVNSQEVTAVLAGWGGTGGKALQARGVAVLTGGDCKALVNSNSTTLLCTEGAGACKGDEGGPLVQDMKNGVSKLVGLAFNTTRISCKNDKTPGSVYVNVARHTAWILNVIYNIAK